MKIVIFMLFPLIAWGQYKPRLAPVIPAMIAGAFDGVGEVTLHRYDAFQKKHPSANPYYWDPRVSWRAKWKDGDPSKGEAFIGSSTYLVSVTDFYHLRRSVSRIGIFTTGVLITIGDKRPLKHYLYDAAIALAANRLAFHVPYTFIYK